MWKTLKAPSLAEMDSMAHEIFDGLPALSQEDRAITVTLQDDSFELMVDPATVEMMPLETFRSRWLAVSAMYSLPVKSTVIGLAEASAKPFRRSSCLE